MFFFDEARFGTHSKLGHGWFPTGLRTTKKVKLGFKNFYVYSAVNVISGVDFSLILPKVDTICMNKFLKHMSLFLGDSEAILVMDGAAWHKSKNLQLPENIEILYLPPYSPELNPVEKLWQQMKACIIKNKIYDSLEELENAVCNFIRNMSPARILQTCSINHCLS